MNARSLVGMTIGARKRAARRGGARAWSENWRLRPCRGCWKCNETLEGYGTFPGGDPRQFTPDPECSTEAERELHRQDCEAWAAGNEVRRPVSGVEWLAAGTYKDRTGKPNAGGPAFVTRAAYGLGTYRLVYDPGGKPCTGSGVLPAKGGGKC